IMDTWIFRPGHPVITISQGDHRIEVTQERFGFAADPAAGAQPVTETDRVVPLVLRIGHGDGSTVHRLLLDSPSASVAIDHPVDWIVGNHEGNGFYRVALSDEALGAVGSRALADLSPLERYGLVEDEWALVLAGRGSIPRVLGLLRSLSAETDVSVWQRMVGVIGSLHRLTGEHRDQFEPWVRALVAPALHALGPERVDGEPERTTSLRATLTIAAARYGADVAQIDLAASRFAELRTDPTVVDPDLIDATVRVVAATGDAHGWDALRGRAPAR